MRGLSQGRGRKRGFNNVQRGIVYLKAEYAQWLPAGGTHLEHGQTQLPPPGRITAYPGSIDGFISLLCLLLSLSMSFSCSLSHHLSLLSFACFTTCYLCCCHPPDSADQVPSPLSPLGLLSLLSCQYPWTASVSHRLVLCKTNVKTN